jgi:nitrous oxidase accessory protein NosD
MLNLGKITITFALVMFVFTTSLTFADSHCTNVDTSKGLLSTAYEASNNETITGTIDATGCDIGVYVPVGVKNVNVCATIHDANKYGVFNNGNAKVDGSEIYNIGNHNASGDFDPNGAQTGVGVYFFDATGSVVDSNIHDYQKGGVVINGDSKANVTNNTIAGFDSVPFIAQNGIQFGYGATGNAMNNSVTGNWYSGADWASTGILLFETDKVTIQGNTVEDCQIGVGIEAWCWFEESASKNNIINNCILGADYGVTVAAYSLGFGYSQCDASSDNNKVINNLISSTDGSEGVFVGVGQFWGGTDNPTADNNKVIHNTISGFDTEISQSGDTSSKIHANVIE